MTKSKTDPADYVLTKLTDLPSVNYTRLQNLAAWKNLLTAEEYVDREYVLGKAKITSSEVNRLTVFGLSNRENPDVIVSSIELLVREAWRFHRTSNGSVEKTNIRSGCIGGVFTYPEYRGCGFATIMVDKLMEIAAAPEYLGPHGFMFLYSEVGEYYTRNGFKSFAVPLLNVPLVEHDQKYLPEPNVHLIRYHEFDGLFRVLNEHCEQELRQKVGSDGIDRISVNPTAEYIDWFHLRVKYFSTKLFGDTGLVYDPYKDTYEELVEKFTQIEPFYFGLRVDCPETGELKGFIVWQYEYNGDSKGNFKNYVTVIKTFVNTPKFDKDAVQMELVLHMKKYLEAFHPAPQMSNFTKIVIWESEISDDVLACLVKKHGAVHGLENGSRSAIRSMNAEEDQKLRSGSVVWENNNKLPWF